MKIPTDSKSLDQLRSDRIANLAVPREIKVYKMEGDDAVRIRTAWDKAKTAEDFRARVERPGETLALLRGRYCIVNKDGAACWLHNIIDAGNGYIHESLIDIIHEVPHAAEAIKSMNTPYPDDAGAVLDEPTPGDKRTPDNTRQQDQGRSYAHQDDAGAVLDEPAPDNKPSSPEKPRDDRGDID